MSISELLRWTDHWLTLARCESDLVTRHAFLINIRDAATEALNLSHEDITRLEKGGSHE